MNSQRRQVTKSHRERLEKTSDTVERGRASCKRISREMIRVVTASRSHEKFLDLESPSDEEAVEQGMPCNNRVVPIFFLALHLGCVAACRSDGQLASLTPILH
ncbi:hypothetical protein B0H14DRAFT_2619381 [Mycena olivaceomarginata]|nr:hypothetical protein B0H14DRAFT_2619381 [Mycena olivaceomarginata]